MWFGTEAEIYPAALNVEPAVFLWGISAQLLCNSGEEACLWAGALQNCSVRWGLTGESQRMGVNLGSKGNTQGHEAFCLLCLGSPLPL